MIKSLLLQKNRFYQAANEDDVLAIKESFLIRLHEFDIIMSDIRTNEMVGSVQHYLLLGRRGSGKSTLLKRIEVEITEDAELSSQFLPVNLAEEQADIYRLYDLIHAILEELEEKKYEVRFPEPEDDCNTYTRNLIGALHEAIDRCGKKVILLLDNIHRILENLADDANLLREYLLNYKDIKIIGGSTRMTEHFWKYNQAFYQFFRIMELKPLTGDEIRMLFENWSRTPGMEYLKEFAENKSGQLETIRILTDGLPRTLQFFVNILVNNSNDTGFEYLRQIMDVATPQYQERLNNVSPAQRKIVLQTAFLWEAAGARDIAKASHMDTNAVSAQLKQLSELSIIEKIDTGKKNHLYRISERFFNLWLIFTQGSPKEKRKAKYLTIFLENFYDEEEIRKLANRHLQQLQTGQISADKAGILTKAFAQSKFIDVVQRDSLINLTLGMANLPSDIKNQLPQTIVSILYEIDSLMGKKEFEKAISLANSIEQEDGMKDLVKSRMYLEVNEWEQAQYFLEQSILKDTSHHYLVACNNLQGLIHFHYGNYQMAEPYFLKSESFSDSLRLLVHIYINSGKYDLAEKYFYKAVQRNENQDIMWEIIFIYVRQNEFEEAEAALLTLPVNQKSFAEMLLGTGYYFLAQNKQRALELVNKPVENRPDWNNWDILIRAWNGDMQAVQEGANQLLKERNFEQLDTFLERLLYHFQFNLVCNIFHDEEYGDDFREKYQPLYYAACILAGKDAQVELKIPPELRETVDLILTKVKEGQKLYHGLKE